MASVDAQKRARDAWFMGAERANRPLTATEKHRQWADERAVCLRDRVVAASDWLLTRCPELATDGGMACGLAIHAVMGLRDERPDLTGDALLKAALAHRNDKLRAAGADDLVVEVAA